MPELPEVETVRRGLNQKTLHQTIQGGAVLLHRTIAYPADVQQFLDALKGVAIAEWHRRGKYLLASLERPGAEADERPAGWLGVHLRMTGQLLWLDQTEPLHKHTRVRLLFGDRKELRFVDQRTFGQLWWVPAEQLPEQIITGLQSLGPEPFSEDFSLAYFQQQLQNRQRPIKNALVDQAIVAGIGNIYADEALFLSGIRPQTLCAKLRRSQFEKLRANVLQVLQASIDANGTTFSNYRTVEGINGNYGGQAWVYGRDGKPCHNCTTMIQRVKLAGRSAHFCPKCQK